MAGSQSQPDHVVNQIIGTGAGFLNTMPACIILPQLPVA
jgi:hypothetical protein